MRWPLKASPEAVSMSNDYKNVAIAVTLFNSYAGGGIMEGDEGDRDDRAVLLDDPKWP
jgi:hypothetical protein